MTCIAEKACRLEGDDGYLLLQTLAASSISLSEAQAKKSRSTSKHICFFLGGASRHLKGSGGFRSTTMLQSARLHCTLRTARSKWSQCRMIVYNVALLEPNVSCAGAHGLYTRPCGVSWNALCPMWPAGDAKRLQFRGQEGDPLQRSRGASRDHSVHHSYV